MCSQTFQFFSFNGNNDCSVYRKDNGSHWLFLSQKSPDCTVRSSHFFTSNAVSNKPGMLKKQILKLLWLPIQIKDFFKLFRIIDALTIHCFKCTEVVGKFTGKIIKFQTAKFIQILPFHKSFSSSSYCRKTSRRKQYTIRHISLLMSLHMMSAHKGQSFNQ